jgi:hypothetical protein
LFCGVTAFNTEDFLGANDYPNVYWGWGSEDDGIYLRVVKELKKTVICYPIEIARYKMIRSYHRMTPVNPHRRKILHSQYNYKLHRMTFYKLFTLTEETYQPIRARRNITENTRQ